MLQQQKNVSHVVDQVRALHPTHPAAHYSYSRCIYEGQAPYRIPAGNGCETVMAERT